MLALYRLKNRIISKIFSIIFSRSFKQFGKNSVITPPLRISGEKYIKIGSNVFLGSNCWLQVINQEKYMDGTAIQIGDRTSIVGSSIISAAKEIIIEEDVLIARNVYIADHMHQFEDKGIPVKEQGISRIKPVCIKAGAWLGQNVIIYPGVTVGKGSVIGANSVVTRDIPEFCTAAGLPARIIRNF